MKKKAKIEAKIDLPDEVLNKVFEFLPLYSLQKTTETCKKFQKTINESKTIWNSGLTKSLLEKKNQRLSQYEEDRSYLIKELSETEDYQEGTGVVFKNIPKVFMNGIQYVNLEILEKKDLKRNDIIRFAKCISLLLKVDKILIKEKLTLSSEADHCYLCFIFDDNNKDETSKQIISAYGVELELPVGPLEYVENEIKGEGDEEDEEDFQKKTKTWKKILNCFNFKNYETFVIGMEEINPAPFFLVGKHEGYLIGVMSGGVYT